MEYTTLDALPQGKASLFAKKFYGRQEVYARKWSVKKHNEIKTGYAPVCENIWKDFCHLKTKSGTKCAACEHARHLPVSSESIFKHISGQEEQMFYVLQPDGMIKFGVIDFDLKPGNESKGYSWFHVKVVSDVLSRWGMPHHIARSTTFGFHIYLFFREYYPAYKFRSLILELYEQAGIMEYMRTGEKQIPEFFPKQSTLSVDGLGNGIKPPMIEPQILLGRNCFVDKENIVIGEGFADAEKIRLQWEYLAVSEEISHELIEKVISQEKVKLYDQSKRLRTKINAAEPERWEPPLTGSIEKVLEGCRALNSLKKKAKAGEILGHDEGFSLYYFAMATRDGLKWFEKNVPGWGATASDRAQLDHSLRKNYNPPTCRNLQEKGICPVGTKCFEPRPPREMKDGKTVLRDDLPLDQWPSPSPIRYAFGDGSALYDKLTATAAGIAAADPEDKPALVHELLESAQVLDESKQKSLIKYLKNINVLANPQIVKALAQASADHQKVTDTIMEKRSDHVNIEGNWYRRENPGFSQIITSRAGLEKAVRLLSVDIEITKIRTLIDGDTRNILYQGYADSERAQKKFEISTSDWVDNQKFNSFFTGLLGLSFSPQKQNIESLRQAIVGFSKDSATVEVAYSLQGYQNGKYLMPSSVIDADGIHENLDSPVELSAKQHASHLDFSKISLEELIISLEHLNSDLLNLSSRSATTIGLAHTLTPVVAGYIGQQNHRATLFLEGETGSGKTKLCIFWQNFYGKFSNVLNMVSTFKGLQAICYEFKDCLLIVDDYKGLDRQQDHLINLIQYTFDGNSSVKLTRDSNVMRPKPSQSYLTICGEQFINSEASTIARSLLVKLPKADFSRTKELLQRCESRCSTYSGVTAHFIHFVMNFDKSQIAELIRTCSEAIEISLGERQNASRIAGSLGINHAVFRLYLEFCKAHGVLDQVQINEMIEEHWRYALEIAESTCSLASEESSAKIFVDNLIEMIRAGIVNIENHPSFDQLGAKPRIGHRVAVNGKNYLCFEPNLLFKTVIDNAPKNSIRANMQSIWRDLAAKGILVPDKDGKHWARQVPMGGGKHPRLIVLDIVDQITTH